MKNLKYNIIKVLCSIFISLSFASCDAGGDPEAGGTTTQDFAGDWFINVKVEGVSKFIRFSTYNTSANDNTMFLDDNGLSQTKPTSQLLKAKYTVDLSTGNFASDVSTPNFRQSNQTVTITNGKIEKKAGISKGGHTVDKISFTVEYSNKPGVKYDYVGTKRTGFKEDEY